MESRVVGSASRTLLVLVLLGIVPLFLRLVPIEHGAPRPEYVPDTHVVRNALGMAATKDLAPPVNTYSTYPYGLSYVLLPVYAVDFAVGKVRGKWDSGEAYGNHLRTHPWHAHRLARIVLALIASLTPLLIFGAARAAGLGMGAFVAAWLCATSLLHVHMSLMERPWAPMMAALAATVWASTVHARTGSLRSLLVGALCAAAAGAMHQAGMGFLGIVGIAWLIAPRPEGVGIQRSVRRGIGAVALFGVVVLLVGHPYVLVHGLTDASDVAGQDVRPDDISGFSIGGQQVVFTVRWATLASLGRMFVGYDPVLLLFGIAGLFGAIRQRAFLPPLVFALLWGAFFLTNINEHVRYLLPLAVLLTLPAGFAVERWMTSTPLRLVSVALLALPFVQATRLGIVLRADDTRAIAATLLEDLPADSRVAIDIYGPIVPQTKAALETTARLRPLYAREAFRYAQIAAGELANDGIDAVRLEDAFEYDLRHGGSSLRTLAASDDNQGPLELGDTAESALRGLGATHLLLVDRTPDNGRPPMLIDPTPSTPAEVARAGSPPVPKLRPLEGLAEPMWSVHPAWPEPKTPSPEHTAPDAHLPTALSFPLLDLWRLDRPGPRVDLYRLPR